MTRTITIENLPIKERAAPTDLALIEDSASGSWRSITIGQLASSTGLTGVTDGTGISTETLLTGLARISLNVPVALEHGGTGSTTAAGARTNLGLGDFATRSGTLPLSSGGTGVTSLSALQSALGLGDLAYLDGPLGVGSGGTGVTSIAALKTALALGSLAEESSPLPLDKGGTGATTAALARAALGLGGLAVVNSPLGLDMGGTGATTAAGARSAFGLTSAATTAVGTSKDNLAVLGEGGVWDIARIPTITTAKGGVPAGGAISQVLKKASGTDYDYSWQDETAAGSGVPVPVRNGSIAAGTSGAALNEVQLLGPFNSDDNLIFKVQEDGGDYEVGTVQARFSDVPTQADRFNLSIGQTNEVITFRRDGENLQVKKSAGLSGKVNVVILRHTGQSGVLGDITAVSAGTGLTGGGTSGSVNLSLAIPVTVAHGGTGARDAATARTNLGLGAAALLATPIPVASGGTGSTTGAAALTALGAGTLATKDSPLGLADGGTGATDAEAARTAFGLGSFATLTGNVPLDMGGTGSDTASGARVNLGLGAAALLAVPIPLASGGTGATTASAARTALELGTIAVEDSPLPVAKGGTGVTAIGQLRNALGLGSLAFVTGNLPISSGGTGASTAPAARTALGLGTAATEDTGTASGDIPLLGAGGLLALARIPTISTAKGGLPTGGTSTQFLRKTGSGNYAAAWQTVTFGDITEVIAGTGLSGGGTTGSVTLNLMGKGVKTAQLDDKAATVAKVGDNVARAFGSSHANTIWQGTQAELDAITTKDTRTMYCVEES